MIVKNATKIICNANNRRLQKARKIVVELVDGVIKNVDPYLAVKRNVKIEGKKLKVKKHVFSLSEIERVLVIGGGKASVRMAEALEELLGEKITDGIIVAPKRRPLRKIEVVEAGHPIPTLDGIKGTEKMLSLLEQVNEKDLVFCLLSGGGSALICLPPADLTLEDLRETTDLLLKSGATIHEINIVRKHLSQVKGGQLAAKAQPARVISLIISDVLGNRIDTIASGPTSPDPSTYADALRVLEKYGILKKVPNRVLTHLRKGAGGRIPETPKPNDPLFKNVINSIIADNSDALEAAAKVGKTHRLNVHIFSENMSGEAEKFGKRFADIVKSVAASGVPVKKPALLLCGGETTVRVRGEGKGGRNQELVLSAALRIGGLNAVIASFGTDGIDGPTDAAGAVADGFTLQRAIHLGLNPIAFLERNDSYNFFKQLDDLIITGPTETNVMDVALAVIL